jgi:hypothetical protein
MNPSDTPEISDGYTASQSRCLALVRKHCPRLMRQGGGGLHIQERRATTPEEVARALELYRAGNRVSLIADQMGRARTWVLARLHEAGCRVRAQRGGRRVAA